MLKLEPPIFLTNGTVYPWPSDNFSADGENWALGFENGHIEVHSLIDGKLAYRITNQTSPIEQLAFTPDSKYLIVVAQDCSKTIYQASDGMFLHSLEELTAELDPVGVTRLQIGNIALSSDSKKIISNFWGVQKFGIWDAATGALLGVYPTEEIHGISRLNSLPNEERFVGLGGTYSTSAFSLWDINSTSLITEAIVDKGNYYYGSLAIALGGNLLAASSIKELLICGKLILQNSCRHF